ncbi:MAG: zf-HC2 domain-containing protein, partial [Chlorobiales bacterium]|nr:zf-HC2 domain-containing protein [Chlorobiales bacterium]
MKCEQIRDNLIAYLEVLLDSTQTTDIEQHLNQCAACRLEAVRLQQLQARLIADGEALRTRTAADSVMTRIRHAQTEKRRRNAMRNRFGTIGFGVAAAAALLAVIVTPWGGGQSTQATAAQVFARAVDALSDLQSVYLKLNMRTSPHDNFELILPDRDFVTIEMWKEFDDSPRWRAEEPGRVVVMDGETTLCHIKPNQAFQRKPAPTFQAWIGALMDVDKVLDNQLELVRRYGWATQVKEVPVSNSHKQLVVTIDAPPDADFDNGNDYLRNKSISDSQRRCVYRFDAETHRLEDLQVWVVLEDRDVLVLDIE